MRVQLRRGRELDKRVGNERRHYQKRKNIMVKPRMCICEGTSLVQVVKVKHEVKNVQVGKT